MHTHLYISVYRDHPGDVRHRAPSQQPRVGKHPDNDAKKNLSFTKVPCGLSSDALRTGVVRVYGRAHVRCPCRGQVSFTVIVLGRVRF